MSLPLPDFLRRRSLGGLSRTSKLRGRALIALSGAALSFSALCVDASALAAHSRGPTPASIASELGSPVWPRGRKDADAGLPGRWQRELTRRQDILEGLAVDDPARARALFGLVRELAGELPHATLSQFLDAVGPPERLDPHVANLLRRQRAQLAAAHGQSRRAHEMYLELGHVSEWLIIGPFEKIGESEAQDIVHPPERVAFARDQSFMGKLPDEALSWRELGNASLGPDGGVDLGELLYPNDRATAYATTWVYVPEATEAVVHIGSSGPQRLWHDDELVAQGDAQRPAHPLQDSHSLHLNAGWQRLMLRIDVEEGPWQFQMWLRRADASAIAGLITTSDPQRAQAGRSVIEQVIDGLDLSGPSKTRAPGKQARRGASKPLRAQRSISLRQALERAADQPRAPVPALQALLDYYRYVRPFDRDDPRAVDLARIIDERAPTARTALQWAVIDKVSNERRRLLDLALQRSMASSDGDDVELRGTILFERAVRDQEARLFQRARHGVVRALEANPDDAIIELAAIGMLEADGLQLAALEWSRDLLRRYPNSLTIAREHASRLVQLGRADESAQLLAELSLSHPADALVLRQRIQLALDAGDLDQALALARTYAAAAPHSPASHRLLAQVHQSAQQPTRAMMAQARAIELTPHHPQLQLEQGRYATRAGETQLGLAAYRRSLELHPQQPALKDLVADMGDVQQADLFTRRGLDLRKVAAQARPADPERDVEVLARRVAVRIEESGLGERLEHTILRINDVRGTRDGFVRNFAYDPDMSRVEVRRARVLHPDGRIERAGRRGVRSLAAAGYRMYYDQRVSSVSFPGLEAGDIVEIAFLRRDIARRSLFDHHFGDLDLVQGQYPRHSSDFWLELPTGIKAHANLDLNREASDDPQIAVYSASWPSLPHIRVEDRMPGASEVADYVHISSFSTWNEVAQWYWKLVRGQLRVDAAIRKGVRTALAPLPASADTLAKIAAVHAHVVQKTRYVGLEFGIHGYKPYPTNEVYDRRFGDCKDKASLLKVMLAEIGVPAHLVLIRTRDRGRIEAHPPSLAVFNHAIVYLPEQDLYLDGTAEFSGLHELPDGDRGASALIVRDADGGSFVTTPESSPELNRETRIMRLQVSRQGAMRGTVSGTVRGSAAAPWRRHFQASERWHDGLRDHLAQGFPGIELEKVRFSNTEDLTRPVQFEARLEIPKAARATAKGRRFRVLARDSALLRNLAAPTERKHPLLWATPSVREEHFEYTLAKGSAFSQVPTNRVIESPHGRFELRVETEGRKASVEMTWLRKTRQIAVPEYEELRSFLREIDNALRQEFEFERGAL